ncbi:MAG: hypothetical protein WCK76_04380 [Elusimicrobiota bacterium]
MEGNSKPVFVLAFASTVVLTGGFLFFVYMDAESRKPEGMRSHFDLRGAASTASVYFHDVEKKGAELKTRAGNYLSGFFGGGAGPAAPAVQTADARQEPAQEQYSAEDEFEKYFKKSSEDGGASGGNPWADMGEGGASGGGVAGGGAGGSLTEAAAGPAPKAASKKVAWDGSASPDVKAPAYSPRAVLNVPAQEGLRSAAPRTFASLTPREGPGGSESGPGYGKGGVDYGDKARNAASGFNNAQGKGTASLDGASESERSGAQSSYNSKMSGGAAAAAGAGAAGGGSAPAASGPKAAEDGKAGAAADGKTGADAGKTADADKTAAGAATKNKRDKSMLSSDDAAEEDTDLLKSVVTDRQKGLEVKYVTDEEAKEPPEPTLLKANVTDGDNTKSAEVAAPDSPKFASLPAARKLELRKEIHRFLKRIEVRFESPMTGIYSTSCNTTPELCADHGITMSYLTMTTENSGQVVMGLKYANTRWRRHVIDFKRPDGVTGGQRHHQHTPADDQKSEE